MDSLAEITDQNELRWNLLQRKAQEVRVAAAFTLFRSHNIEPILIKGWASARNYPPSKTRYSIDLDLAVADRDFRPAVEICKSKAAEGMAIDLHRELRHLDTVDWSNLIENSLLVDANGVSVRILRPEDHLRVLCVHWLTDGGSHRERLWDIYYTIDFFRQSFDWERCLDAVDARRRRWIVCTIGLASKYLELDLKDTPLSEEALRVPGWLVRTVEDEWSSETKHWPLESSLHDPKLFLRQLRRRLRPNPIWATVNLNGSFDARTRLFYQSANFALRIPSSIKRITRLIYRTAANNE